MRKSYHQDILCQRKQCAACSGSVSVAIEGTQKDIGFLCPYHKDEVTYLREQLKNKDNLVKTHFNDYQTLKNTLNSEQRQSKDLQAEIRALHSQLTEQEDLAKVLNSVKSKLAEWIKLLKKESKPSK